MIDRRGETDGSGATRAARSVRQIADEVRAVFDSDRFLLGVTAVGLGVVAACSIVIAELLDDVMGAEGAARRDPKVLSWMLEQRTDALTTLFRTVTHLADPMVVVLVAVTVTLVLLRAHRRRLALLVAASTVGTAVITAVAKLAVDRSRPPQVLWLADATGAAFPSGHAAQAVALYGALAVVVWTLVRPLSLRIASVVLAGVIAVAVGVSRMYLAVHWASDVLCGWAIAALWVTTLLLIGWSLPRLRRLMSVDPADH